MEASKYPACSALVSALCLDNICPEVNDILVVKNKMNSFAMVSVSVSGGCVWILCSLEGAVDASPIASNDFRTAAVAFEEMIEAHVLLFPKDLSHITSRTG